jgi:hypothetical protein
MPNARSTLVAVALGLLLVTGCAPRLKEEKKYTLGAGEAQVLDLPAISKAQKVTVEFSSSAAEVSVYLIKDFREKDGLDGPPNKDQILGQQQAKDGSFSADVPPKTATRVIVRNPNKDTEVTVKVTNAN